MVCNRFSPHHGHGFVRREIVAVILQHEQIERRNETVGSVASDEINLLFFQRASKQAQIHNARRFCESQSVGCCESFVYVRTLHELITKAGPPLGSIRGCLRDRLQLQPPSILATYHNGKRIVESKWRS